MDASGAFQTLSGAKSRVLLGAGVSVRGGAAAGVAAVTVDPRRPVVIRSATSPRPRRTVTACSAEKGPAMLTVARPTLSFARPLIAESETTTRGRRLRAATGRVRRPLAWSVSAPARVRPSETRLRAKRMSVPDAWRFASPKLTVTSVAGANRCVLAPAAAGIATMARTTRIVVNLRCRNKATSIYRRE